MCRRNIFANKDIPKWLTYPKLLKYSYAAQVLGYRLISCVFSYVGHCSYFAQHKKNLKKKWDRGMEVNTLFLTLVGYQK